MYYKNWVYSFFTLELLLDCAEYKLKLEKKLVSEDKVNLDFVEHVFAWMFRFLLVSKKKLLVVRYIFVWWFLVSRSLYLALLTEKVCRKCDVCWKELLSNVVVFAKESIETVEPIEECISPKYCSLVHCKHFKLEWKPVFWIAANWPCRQHWEDGIKIEDALRNESDPSDNEFSDWFFNFLLARFSL